MFFSCRYYMHKTFCNDLKFGLNLQLPVIAKGQCAQIGRFIGIWATY